MPTLEDAFRALRASFHGTLEPRADEIEDLSPFARSVAVIAERGFAGAKWRAAIDALADADLLTARALAHAELPELVDALAEKGIRAQARALAPLKHLARFVVDGPGSRTVFADHDDDGHDALESAIPARDDLAAVKGIGPATADAMILLALGRPSYPVDRPTYRVLVRHGWIDSTTSYEEARDSIVDRAMSMADGSDEAAALDLAALGHAMAELGRQFCRARAPLCAGCPLEHLLPEGGPRDGDA